RTHRPDRQSFHRTGESPEIRAVCDNESARPINLARRTPAVLAQTVDQVEQRRMQLAEGTGLREPVGHLRIDVEVPPAEPRRIRLGVPQALRGGGQRAGAGGGDEQLPSVVQIKRRQSGSGAAGTNLDQALIRGAVRGRDVAQRKLPPPEITLMVLAMPPL